MPGAKYASIKRPKVYEALRDKGLPKAQAAAISNAQANDGEHEASKAIRKQMKKRRR